MSKKMIIFGANGMLGKRFVACFQDYNILPLSHQDFDITNENDYQKLDYFNPDFIVNCAAYTNVTKAESDIENAFRVNELGSELIAKFADNCNAKLIHISTDYVFEGRNNGNYTEEESKNPIGQYGLSKLAGENKIITFCKNYLIVRVSWLFGPNGKNFVASVAKLMQERDELSIVADQFSRVTYTEDVISAIKALITSDAKGIYHIANKGTISRYDFTKKIYEILNRKISFTCDIKPIPGIEYPDPTPRPVNSSLNTDKFEKEFWELPSWEDALERFLSEN
jgi:dTDP-4-dehydrorhamnose reductase